MKVKICGITSLEDARACWEAGVDAIGFNFAEEAKQRGRYIDPQKAWHIIDQLPPFISSVAITVNASVDFLKTCLAHVDYVQLSGDESPALCRSLGKGVIKSFQITPSFQVEYMEAYPADMFLLDAYIPGAHGGTGRTCDWYRARQIVRKSSRPVMLAGGLTPDNVAKAIQEVYPYAVDVAGGVEESPGKKDHQKIREFVYHAKNAISLSG